MRQGRIELLHVKRRALVEHQPELYLPIDKTYGFVCHWSPLLEEEWFEVGRVSFRNLHFSLRDARGGVVPLHGSHLSLRLIFGWPKFV
jgi:hypothetical protein